MIVHAHKGTPHVGKRVDGGHTHAPCPRQAEDSRTLRRMSAQK